MKAVRRSLAPTPAALSTSHWHPAVAVADDALRAKSQRSAIDNSPFATEQRIRSRGISPRACFTGGALRSQRVRLPLRRLEDRHRAPVSRVFPGATGRLRSLTLRSRADPPRQAALPGSRARAILRLPGKAPCLCGPLSSNVRRRKPEVLHGRRSYAPACRPGLPTGQASSRVRVAPVSIGLWSSDAWKNPNRSRVLASARQVRACWPVARTGGA
jgi:hypothetical protein